MAKFVFYLVFILFLITPVLAQEGAQCITKVESDALHQKTVAQVNAKMDANTQRIQESFFREIAKQKQELKDEIGAEISGNLKAIAIGLGGIIIVTLGVFKIIDLKFTSTRGIKKYEEELKKKSKEMDDIINVHRKELDIYRDTLSKFAVEQGFKPIQKDWQEPKVPEPPKGFGKKSLKRRIFPFVIGLGVLTIIIFIIYYTFLR